MGAVEVPGAGHAAYSEALQLTGISRHTANRFEALANVPKPVFEQALSSLAARPTTNGILRAANGAAS